MKRRLKWWGGRLLFMAVFLPIGILFVQAEETAAVTDEEVYPLSVSDIACDKALKSYDGTTKAEAELFLTGIDREKVVVDYRTASYDTPYAGTGKTVTFTGLSLRGKDAERYVLTGNTASISFRCGEITAAIPSLPEKISAVCGGEKIDLQKLVTWTSSFEQDINADMKGCTISGHVITTGTVPVEFPIRITASAQDKNGDGMPEYYPLDSIVWCSVAESKTVTPPVLTEDPTSEGTEGKTKTEETSPWIENTAPPLTISSAESVFYGQSLTVTVTGGGGNGALHYRVENGSGMATISSSGVLTAQKVGKVTVLVTKDADGVYPASSASAVVTIRPAAVTVKANDKTAKVGEPVPVLGSTDYTVAGLIGGDTLKQPPTLTYETAPDMTKPGTFTIGVSGAVLPDGGNYTLSYATGTLTVTADSLYAVNVQEALHGRITATPTAAAAGAAITLTATPDPGYQLTALSLEAQDGTVQALAADTNGRCTFFMPAGSVLIKSSFSPLEPTVPQTTVLFSDVSPTDWFYSSVGYVVEKGLMNGTGNGTFSPYLTTTRGMIVTILYRMSGSPDAGSWAPFADVAREKYYAPAVSWAAWNGIVSGYDAARFGPDDPITREQFAVILCRYAQFKGCAVTTQGNLTKFRDAGQIGTYAREALGWAVQTGLMTGKSADILDPKGKATRAEAATILQRFCEMVSA